MGRTKAAYVKKIMESDLGSINCSEMTSDKLVAFSRSLPVSRRRGPTISRTYPPSSRLPRLLGNTRCPSGNSRTRWSQ